MPTKIAPNKSPVIRNNTKNQSTYNIINHDHAPSTKHRTGVKQQPRWQNPKDTAEQLQKLWHRVEVLQSKKERDPNNIFPVANSIEVTVKGSGKKIYKDFVMPTLLAKFGENNEHQ